MINYINNKLNITLMKSNKLEIGELIVCIDESYNITNNKIYEALFVYESREMTIVQVIDDGDEISGYDIKQFETLNIVREKKLIKALSN
tara:strand:+ start:250 stop:516 length:267 start_codon:yes stop_codon:yes gene_type:complete